MSIDYEKIEGFKSLETKEAKASLATYALETFGVKLNKQKSFENMLADLEAGIPVEEEKPEMLIDSPEPVVAIDATATDEEDNVNGYVQFADEVISVDENTIVVNVDGEEKTLDSNSHLVVVPEPVVEAPVSPVVESTDELAWLDTFIPTIVLMGRSASNNGFYTCPWWIYDWMCQNPEWYKDPDQCPHASAIPTLKSLVYFIKRDGSVMIRETRNSRFVKIEF
ncbi:minor capsid protein inhibitor of protease [Yersinia phage JC221]|nr:minor capsid protein inhibitor of protease [Yersinia phage JC221]